MNRSMQDGFVGATAMVLGLGYVGLLYTVPVQTITVTAATVSTLRAYMNIKDILDNAHNKRIEEAKAAETLKETQEKEAIVQHKAELRHNLVAEADKQGLFDKKEGTSKAFGLSALGLSENKPVCGYGPSNFDLALRV